MSSGLPDNEGVMIEHDGECHDDCPHFQALLKEVLGRAMQPRVAIVVDNLGFVSYASALPPSRSAELLRALADAVERRAARRMSSYMN